MPKLIVTEKGSDNERAYEFMRDGLTIGRSAENTIKLDDNGISRQHARVVIEGGNIFLMDMDSGNGTVLNGAKVKPGEKILLRHGDMISIENYNLRFSQIDEMLSSSFNEITESDILEVKLLKKVLRAIDKESVPSLEVLNGDFVGKKMFLAEGEDEIIVGRDPSCNFPVEEYMISRKHAKIERKGDVVLISDLASKNGTFVNNRRITEEAIHDGDRIALGTIILMFRNPKEVNLESVKVIRRPPEPAPVREEGPDSTESEAFQDMGELSDAVPEEYPTPQPRKEKITLSPFEMGAVGFGLLILVFAIVSLINLLAK